MLSNLWYLGVAIVHATGAVQNIYIDIFRVKTEQ